MSCESPWVVERSERSGRRLESQGGPGGRKHPGGAQRSRPDEVGGPGQLRDDVGCVACMHDDAVDALGLTDVLAEGPDRHACPPLRGPQPGGRMTLSPRRQARGARGACGRDRGGRTARRRSGDGFDPLDPWVSPGRDYVSGLRAGALAGLRARTMAELARGCTRCVASTSTRANPAPCNRSWYCSRVNAPAMQPVQDSMSRRVASSRSGSATTSETANRPPGRSTLAASARARALSVVRLITQLEMTTSTLAVGSGMSSMSPFRNSTLATPAS